MSKSPSKKSTSKKPVVKVIKRTRKSNVLHDRLEKLFTQKGGCTMHDTYNAATPIQRQQR